jgi:Glycosyl transferase family 2
MAGLPSFSLVIEAYNLPSGGLARLRASLDSIAGEEPSPGEAREVLVVSSGQLSAEDYAGLQRSYPWLTLHRLPPTMSYGDMKAAGVAATSGEIVILLDCDCVYERGWLRHLLVPFGDDPKCAAVTGETQTPLRGPYDLAASFTWNFSRFTGETELAPARYYSHPGALRRAVLQDCPMPLGLPIVRGGAIIHSVALRRAGYTIWRQPLARTHHPLPSPGELLARFFAQGHDSVIMPRLVGDPSGASLRGFLVPPTRSVGRLAHIAGRVRAVLAEDRRRLLWMPVALPIACVFAVSYWAGRMLTRRSPATAHRLLCE